MKFLKGTFAAFVIMLLAGCVNIYTRWPTTSTRIEDTYQSTQTSFAFSYVVMFPQVIDMGSGHDAFVPENLITIPCGCVCFCDTILEAVVDTVCYPYDLHISNKRKQESKNK